MNKLNEFNPFKLINKEHRGNKKLIVIAVITIILGILLGIFIYKYMKKPSKHVYLLEPKNAKKFKNVKLDPSINQGDSYDFSISFWYLLSDWGFKNKKSKHILSKGTVRDENAHTSKNKKWLNVCPAIFFTKNINNMKIYIRTKSGIESILMKDMPMNLWTHVAINNRDRTTSIYINGMLHKTLTLNGFPIINNKSIKVNSDKGFSGQMSTIRFYPNAISFHDIQKQYKYGPYGYHFRSYINNYFKNLFGVGSETKINTGSEVNVGTCQNNETN